jgi:hypothetical protein
VQWNLARSTLEVENRLQPADDPGRFDLKIDDAVERAGAGDGEGTGPIPVKAAAHTVSESVASGAPVTLDEYDTTVQCLDQDTQAAIPVGSLAVQPGQHVKCVFTNSRRPPPPAGGGGASPLEAPSVTSTATGGPTELLPGAGGSTSSAPALGATVGVRRVSGRVRIRPKGQKNFHDLTDSETIPVGTEVDTTHGRVALTSAVDAGATTQTGEFSKGLFVVTQRAAAGGLTTLTLSGALSCPRGGRAAAAANPKKRRLWGDGGGNFQTRGKHGSATKRGTVWLTEDRCTGTFFRVTEGTITVRDFALHKNVVVTAGHSYLARARP